MRLKNSNINITQILKVICTYFVVYGVMLTEHYSQDSYNYHMDPVANNVGNLASGRLGDYFVNSLANLFHINYVDYQPVFIVLLIAALAVCSELIFNHYVTIMNQEIANDRKILLRLAIFLMFCNVFIIEWFVFVEMTFSWSLSVLFMACAVLQIGKDNNLPKMALCTLYMIISVSFYQSTISFFVSFALLGIYIAHDGVLTKKSFIESVKVLICGGFAGAINILTLKILQATGMAYKTGRTDSLTTEELIRNTKAIIHVIKDTIINAYGLLPRYSVLMILIVLVVLVCISGGNAKLRVGDYIYMLLALGMCILVVYSPHLLTADLWITQRSVVGFWIILTLPAVIILIKNENKTIGRIAILVLSLFIVLNVSMIQQISANVIAGNRVDEEFSYLVQNEIAKYEEENGVKIEKIAVANDVRPSYHYRSIDFASMNLMTRSFCVSWGGVESINYYNKTNYKKVEMDEIIREKYFEGRDWDCMDLEEQLAFDGDTLYMIAY